MLGKLEFLDNKLFPTCLETEKLRKGLNNYEVHLFPSSVADMQIPIRAFLFSFINIYLG